MIARHLHGEGSSGGGDLPDVAADARKILWITWIGVAINIFLTVFKIGIGAVTGSLALVADGVHSLFDMVTDIVVIVATRMGSRPPDAEHPWGHGKMETLGALIISVIFTVAGLEIIKAAGFSLLHGESRFPGVGMIVVALASLVANEWLFRASRRIAAETGSQALMANAWHHRSDALSSVAVFVGGVTALIGWGWADGAAGVVVGVLIMVAGVRFVFSSVAELLEHSAEPETLDRIRSIVDGIDEVRGWHALRTRYVGRELHVDLHIFVPRDRTIVQGDEAAHLVMSRIREGLGVPVDVIVHIDPEPPPPPPAARESTGVDAPPGSA